MEKAAIIRTTQGDQGTFGHLVAGDFSCRTIELPWRDNQPGASRILPGTYACGFYQSPLHGPVYLLKDVPNRSMIEIHVANFAGDIYLGFASDVLGCIGLGTTRGKLWTGEGSARKEQPAIQNSQVTVDLFLKLMKQEPFSLSIYEAFSLKEA